MQQERRFAVLFFLPHRQGELEAEQSVPGGKIADAAGALGDGADGAAAVAMAGAVGNGQPVFHLQFPDVGVFHLDEQLAEAHGAVEREPALPLRQRRRGAQRIFQQSSVSATESSFGARTSARKSTPNRSARAAKEEQSRFSSSFSQNERGVTASTSACTRRI